jgi:hypothetical protein
MPEAGWRLDGAHQGLADVLAVHGVTGGARDPDDGIVRISGRICSPPHADRVEEAAGRVTTPTGGISPHLRLVIGPCHRRAAPGIDVRVRRGRIVAGGAHGHPQDSRPVASLRDRARAVTARTPHPAQALEHVRQLVVRPSSSRPESQLVRHVEEAAVAQATFADDVTVEHATCVRRGDLTSA